MGMEKITNPEKPKRNYKAGPGRPKGSTNDPNILQMRNIMRLAISRVGGAEALVKFYKKSDENARTFWNLAGRMIPLEVSGPGGEALKVELSWLDGRSIDKSEAVDVVVKQIAEATYDGHTADGNQAPALIPIDVVAHRTTD